MLLIRKLLFKRDKALVSTVVLTALAGSLFYGPIPAWDVYLIKDHSTFSESFSYPPWFSSENLSIERFRIRFSDEDFSRYADKDLKVSFEFSDFLASFFLIVSIFSLIFAPVVVFLAKDNPFLLNSVIIGLYTFAGGSLSFILWLLAGGWGPPLLSLFLLFGFASGAFGVWLNHWKR